MHGWRGKRSRVNSSSIQKLLLALGSTKIHAGATYVHGSCPLSQWTHASGTDSTPSFGVKIVGEGSSGFRCMSASCNAKGSDLKELVWRIEKLSHKDLSELIKFCHENDQPLFERTFTFQSYERAAPVELGGVRVTAAQAMKVLGTAVDLEKAVAAVQTVSEEEQKFWKEKIPKEVVGWAHEYLAERRLTIETAKLWELGVAPKIPFVNQEGKQKWMYGWRVVFPVRDCKNQMVGWSARLIARFCTCRARTPTRDFKPRCHKCDAWVDSEAKSCAEHGEKAVKMACPACGRFPPPKYFHRKGFLRNLFFYGEHRRNPEVKRVILTEGFTDVMGLDAMGYANVFGVMGSFISGVHVEKIVQWFDEAVVFPDGDAGGKQMGDHISEVLRQRMPVKVVYPPPGKDPGELTLDVAQEKLGFGPDLLTKPTNGGIDTDGVG